MDALVSLYGPDSVVAAAAVEIGTGWARDCTGEF